MILPLLLEYRIASLSSESCPEFNARQDGQTHFDSRFAQQLLYALPARFIEKEGKKCRRIEEVSHCRPSWKSSRIRSSTKSRIGLLPARKCLRPRPARRLASSARFGMIFTMRTPVSPLAQSSLVPGAISNSRASSAGIVIWFLPVTVVIMDKTLIKDV